MRKEENGLEARRISVLDHRAFWVTCSDELNESAMSCPSQGLVRVKTSNCAVAAAENTDYEKVAFMMEANLPRSLIGKSLVIKGEVTGLEAMHIERRVEGSIELPGHTITVGRNGQTAALLIASEIVVFGQVRGNCEATDRLEIRSEGSMSGDAIVSQRY